MAATGGQPVGRDARRYTGEMPVPHAITGWEPVPDTTPRWLEPPPLLRLNSLLVLGGIAAFIVSAIPILLFPATTSPFAFCGGIVVLPAVGAFGVVVARSVYFRKVSATRLATAVYLVLAGLCLFAAATEVGEALLSRPISFGFIAGSICIGCTMAAYLAFCGWCSLQWQRAQHRFLEAARGTICRACGYTLRGLSEPRCPECGTPFVTGDYSPEAAQARSDEIQERAGS